MNDYNIVGVFCEDIREEKGSKNTLLGIYADNVNVTEIPGTFIKLAIYIRIHAKPDYDIEDLTFSLRLPDGENIHLGEFDRAGLEKAKASRLETKAPYIGLVIQAAFQQLHIAQPGRLMAIAKINGEEIIAASLNVRAKVKSQDNETKSGNRP